MSTQTTRRRRNRPTEAEPTTEATEAEATTEATEAEPTTEATEAEAIDRTEDGHTPLSAEAGPDDDDDDDATEADDDDDDATEAEPTEATEADTDDDDDPETLAAAAEAAIRTAIDAADDAGGAVPAITAPVVAALRRLNHSRRSPILAAVCGAEMAAALARVDANGTRDPDLVRLAAVAGVQNAVTSELAQAPQARVTDPTAALARLYGHRLRLLLAAHLTAERAREAANGDTALAERAERMAEDAYRALTPEAAAAAIARYLPTSRTQKAAAGGAPAQRAVVVRDYSKLDGERVTFTRGRGAQKLVAEGTVHGDGTVTVDGAGIAESPSAAARRVNGGTEVNGAEAWRLRDGRTIGAAATVGRA